jgi:hypothetical protein
VGEGKGELTGGELGVDGKWMSGELGVESGIGWMGEFRVDLVC